MQLDAKFESSFFPHVQFHCHLSFLKQLSLKDLTYCGEVLENEIIFRSRNGLNSERLE